MTGETRRARLGAAFIKQISAQTLDSTAANHPYLHAMRQGDFPNLHLAYKDFAFQYGLYTTRFICYLSAVIENLKHPEHKQILQSNLAEEKGKAHDIDLPPAVLDSVSGQSHACLYRRFQEALGVDADRDLTPDNGQNGLRWSQQFLRLCETNECVGIGAMGIGTELIVSKVYKQILEGLKAHSDLTMTQRVFFDLHSNCDDEHAAQMILIAEDLAQDHKAREQIAYGAHEAVNLRTEFWDKMLERAQNFTASSSPTNAAAPDVGYQTSLRR